MKPFLDFLIHHPSTSFFTFGDYCVLVMVLGSGGALSVFKGWLQNMGGKAEWSPEGRVQ
jgi:hypothetical protein